MFLSVWKKENTIVLQNFITLPYYFFYCYSTLLKILGRKRPILILSSHGLFQIKPAHYTGKERIKRIIKQALDKNIGVFLANYALDGVQTISEHEKRGLLEGGIKKDVMRIIGNGLEEEAFGDIEGKASDTIRKTAKEHTPYIFQIGRLDRRKNYETAIRTLAALPSRVHLLIVGPNDNNAYYQELLALTKEAGVEARVRFLGVITGADKYYLMRHAVAQIQLAKQEAFGIVIQEAMSQGCICIVAENTAPADIVGKGECGFCVAPDDFKKAAEYVQFLLTHENKEHIKNMKERAIKKTTGRTWDSVSEQVELFYQHVHAVS